MQVNDRNYQSFYGTANLTVQIWAAVKDLLFMVGVTGISQSAPFVLGSPLCAD